MFIDNIYNDPIELFINLKIYYKLINNYDIDINYKKNNNVFELIIINYLKYDNEFDDDLIYMLKNNNLNIIKIIENNNDVTFIIKE